MKSIKNDQDDELEMNLLNIDTNTNNHLNCSNSNNNDRISIEISNLLSPNSKPEILFIEDLLRFIEKSTTGDGGGRGDGTVGLEELKDRPKTWIEELEVKLQSRRDNLKETSFAHKLNKMSFSIIAFNRLPAILSTITLEMGVTLVISSFSTLIQNHMLIAAFFPVLSAIAGMLCEPEQPTSEASWLREAKQSRASMPSLRGMVARGQRS